MRVRTRCLYAAIAAVSLACTPEASVDPPQPGLAPGFTVAAYGDSLTRSYSGESWTANLPEEWGRIVRGVLDEPALVGTARLEHDIDSGLLTSVEDVEVLVLFWGANDVARAGWLDLPLGVTAAEYYADQVENHGLDPELAADYAAASESVTDVRNRLLVSIGRARAAGIDVVLVSPPPRADPESILNPRIAALASALCDAAAQEGVTCIDLYEAFTSHAGGPTALLEADGTHIGPSGRLLIASLVGAAIQPLRDAWIPPLP